MEKSSLFPDWINQLIYQWTTMEKPPVHPDWIKPSIHPDWIYDYLPETSDFHDYTVLVPGIFADVANGPSASCLSVDSQLIKPGQLWAHHPLSPLPEIVTAQSVVDDMKKLDPNQLKIVAHACIELLTKTNHD